VTTTTVVIIVINIFQIISFVVLPEISQEMSVLFSFLSIGLTSRLRKPTLYPRSSLRTKRYCCTVSCKSQIPLRYPASEPARELVRELVCDLLASWQH